jgi:hypothetical protein
MVIPPHLKQNALISAWWRFMYWNVAADEVGDVRGRLSCYGPFRPTYQSLGRIEARPGGVVSLSQGARLHTYIAFQACACIAFSRLGI